LGGMRFSGGGEKLTELQLGKQDLKDITQKKVRESIKNDGCARGNGRCEKGRPGILKKKVYLEEKKTPNISAAAGGRR